MFLMAPWNKTVSYGETMRAEMRAREQAIKNFFQNVDVALREGDAKQAQTAAKWGVSSDALVLCYMAVSNMLVLLLHACSCPVGGVLGVQGRSCLCAA
jgi:hypothetical protein